MSLVGRQVGRLAVEAGQALDALRLAVGETQDAFAQEPASGQLELERSTELESMRAAIGEMQGAVSALVALYGVVDGE